MLPMLRLAPKPRIVNLASGGGSLTPNADPTWEYRSHFGIVYAVSKTAMNAVTLAFAIELASANIKVNSASPGFTATALNNFAGIETVEEGARNPLRVILDEDGPSGTFSGPDGALPW